MNKIIKVTVGTLVMGVGAVLGYSAIKQVREAKNEEEMLEDAKKASDIME